MPRLLCWRDALRVLPQIPEDLGVQAGHQATAPVAAAIGFAIASAGVSAAAIVSAGPLPRVHVADGAQLQLGGDGSRGRLVRLRYPRLHRPDGYQVRLASDLGRWQLQLSAAGQATQKAQYESEAIGLSRENEALQGKLAALSSEAERLTQSQAKLEYERRKDALLVRMPRLAGIACSERPQKGRLKNASTPCTEILSAIERELGAAAARNPRLVQLLQKATREVRACTD